MDRHPLRPSPDPRRSTSPAAAPRIVFLALAVATFTGPVARPYAACAASRAADAPAAAPASASPLIEALILKARRSAPASGVAPTPRPIGFAGAGANPFHALPTPLSNMRATLAPSASARPVALAPPLGAAAAGGAAGAGKFPGTEGISGDDYGHSITPAGDMFGDGVSDVAVGAAYAVGPAGITGEVLFYYGTPAGPTAPKTLFGEQPFDGYGWSVAGVGDVNGDGYPDLLVGAPFHASGGNSQSGKAYLYLGGPSGIASTPAWTFGPGELSAEVGFSVAWAGDVNNDGYDDWIVGAPGHTNGESSEGAAYLFLGGPGGLSNVPAWTYEPNSVDADFGYCVATAGDVNGDGYADLIIGAPFQQTTYASEGKAYLFLGHSVKPSLAPDATWVGGQFGAYYGQSVAAAGDVNGDGYADIVIGAPAYDDSYVNQGKVDIVRGGPLPLLFAPPDVLEGSTTNAAFGAAVGTAGDLNSDGYADIIVGATGEVHLTNQGTAYIFVGSSLGVIPFYYDSIVSQTAGELGGVAVGTMGDFFADGFTDCWMGAPGNGTGEAWALFGHPFVPGYSEITAAQGYQPGQTFGYSGAAADVNGDGFDDLLVGSWAGGNLFGNGLVAVYYGGPDPFQSAGAYPYVAAAPDWTTEGADNDNLGWTLNNAGDVNGDGYQDFITGAFLHNGLQTEEGQALLYYGSPTGPVGGSPWHVEGTQNIGILGYAIGADGDLNGDGYDDVAVAAPQGDVGVPYEGLVNIYYGSKFGLSHTPAIVLRGNQTTAYLGTSCPIVGDINRDGYDDLVVGAEGYTEGETAEGHAFVYLGSATGIHSVPDQTLQIDVAGAAFGWGAYRIGDVNGDGYDDVAIAAPHLHDPDTNEGELFVYYGSPGGLVQPAAWSLEGDQASDFLGMNGISGADVNADGIADLVVGEPNSNYAGPGGGRVRVFLGGLGGLETSAFLDETSGSPSEGLGYATGGEQDFDGDGFPDLFVTAPGLNLIDPMDGGAFVRFGNSIWFGQRNQDRTLGTWRSDDTAPVQPGLRSDALTAFRLKGKARSAAGRTRVRLESEIKPLNVPFSFAGHGISTWQPTGPVAAGQGSSAAVDVPVTGLASATPYHWRARYLTRSLFFPLTPWFSTEQRHSTERQISTAGAPGAVDVPPAPGLKGTAVALAPAAPNPSHGTATSLAFTLPAAGAARLALYDLRGALVRTLFDANATAGTTRVTWDGLDAGGRLAPAGAYFARLTALGKDVTEKLVRLP